MKERRDGERGELEKETLIIFPLSPTSPSSPFLLFYTDLFKIRIADLNLASIIDHPYPFLGKRKGKDAEEKSLPTEKVGWREKIKYIRRREDSNPQTRYR